jgi:hypothetical protein
MRWTLLVDELAAVGLAFASRSSALLVRQLNTWQSTVSLDLALDWRVLAFTAALACLAALIAGVAPALGLNRWTRARRSRTRVAGSSCRTGLMS